MFDRLISVFCVLMTRWIGRWPTSPAIRLVYMVTTPPYVHDSFGQDIFDLLQC